MGWKQFGRITINGEGIAYTEYSNVTGQMTLASKLTPTTSDMIIEEDVFFASPPKIIKINNEYIRPQKYKANDYTTTLNGNIGLNDTVITLTDVRPAPIVKMPAYATIGDEIVLVIAVDEVNKTYEVERGLLHTTASTHNNGDTMQFRHSFHNIIHEISSVVIHNPGDAAEAVRGFYSPSRNGQAHNANSIIKYFESDSTRDKAIQKVYIHEVGHSMNYSHLNFTNNSYIMDGGGLAPGTRASQLPTAFSPYGFANEFTLSDK